MSFALPDKTLVLAIHARSLEAFGGRAGIRDEGLLESALARLENLIAYADAALPIHRVAAALAYGLAKNHPFLDGNKRASFGATDTFLRFNGYELVALDADLTVTWEGLASGSIGEEALADWIASRIRAKGA